MNVVVVYYIDVCDNIHDCTCSVTGRGGGGGEE